MSTLNIINTIISVPPNYQTTRYVSSDGNRVVATVCEEDGSCEDTTLIKYNGDDADKRAEKSARNIQSAADSRLLFTGDIRFKPWRGKVIVDNWTPFNAVTLINLGPENLGFAEKQAKVMEFIQNLWVSGVMPNSKEAAQREVERLQDELGISVEEVDGSDPEIKTPWVIQTKFRDPKIASWKDLANLYFALEEYGLARLFGQRVIDYKGVVTHDRPIYYDETVFLITDVARVQGIKAWSETFFNEAIKWLVDNENNLQELEDGYHTRYQYEMLKTCVLSRQLFPEAILTYENEAGVVETVCDEADLETYTYNATFGYNQDTPTFDDNFLATRSHLELANYYMSWGNFDAAEREYDQTLDLIALIDSSQAVLGGDAQETWDKYEMYMHPHDRWLGAAWNRLGLNSYFLRGEIIRTLRGDFRLFYLSKQFRPDFFLVFQARAHQGKAKIERSKAGAEDDLAKRESHLGQAEARLKEAHSLVSEIKTNKYWAFFTPGMYEERHTYYSVTVDYAEVLFALYSQGNPEYSTELPRVKEMAEEVVKCVSEDPLDITHLRAKFLLGDIALTEGNSAEAVEIYNVILASITEEEAKLEVGRELPPYYQQLKEKCEMRLAVL